MVTVSSSTKLLLEVRGFIYCSRNANFETFQWFFFAADPEGPCFLRRPYMVRMFLILIVISSAVESTQTFENMR